MYKVHDSTACTAQSYVCRLCPCSGEGSDIEMTQNATGKDADGTALGGRCSGNGFIARMARKASHAALYGTSVDIHQTVEEDPFIAALHARAEKFDEGAEHVFGYLQVRVPYCSVLYCTVLIGLCCLLHFVLLAAWV